MISKETAGQNPAVSFCATRKIGKNGLTYPTQVDKSTGNVFAWVIHQGGPDKGLRYCWLSQRSDPLNLIQFILA